MKLTCICWNNMIFWISFECLQTSLQSFQTLVFLYKLDMNYHFLPVKSVFWYAIYSIPLMSILDFILCMFEKCHILVFFRFEFQVYHIGIIPFKLVGPLDRHQVSQRPFISFSTLYDSERVQKWQSQIFEKKSFLRKWGKFNLQGIIEAFCLFLSNY